MNGHFRQGSRANTTFKALKDTFRRPAVCLSLLKVGCGNTGTLPAWQYRYLQFKILPAEGLLSYFWVPRHQHIAHSYLPHLLHRRVPIVQSRHICYIDFGSHWVRFRVGSEWKKVVIGMLNFNLVRLVRWTHSLMVDIISVLLFILRQNYG